MASGMLMGKLRSLVPSTSQCTVAINQFKRDRSANRMRFDDAELDELARGAHFFPTLRIALPDDGLDEPVGVPVTTDIATRTTAAAHSPTTAPSLRTMRPAGCGRRR